MKKQNCNTTKKRQQTSWDAETPEPSCRERTGWVEDVHSQPSSWRLPQPHTRKAPEDPCLNVAGDVDAGYFDQQICILGTDVIVRVAYTAKGVDGWIDDCPPNELIYGFDVEWRPNHFKGQDNYAALCQLSSASRCLIVQLLHMDYIPDKLKAFLADPRKKLAGVGVKGDINKLNEDYDLNCCGEVDVGTYAAAIFKDPKLKRAGLAALCGTVLGITYKKSKRVTMSNWAVHDLNYNQIAYAATDAWISYSLLATLETKQQGDCVASSSTDGFRAHHRPIVALVGGARVGSVQTEPAGNDRG